MHNFGAILSASLLAGGFLNLGPAKHSSKKPFWEEK